MRLLTRELIRGKSNLSATEIASRAAEISHAKASQMSLLERCVGRLLFRELECRWVNAAPGPGRRESWHARMGSPVHERTEVTAN